jgi:predicted membrane protein
MLGAALVLVGLLFLISTVFSLNLWPFIWSVGLILAGVWLLMRPRLTRPGTLVNVDLLGDIRRTGIWQVRNEEFWHGVGDIELDLRGAEMPQGETTLRFYTFVGDVEVIAPRDIAVSVSAQGFAIDAVLFEQDYDGDFRRVEVASEGYAASERQLRLELTGFFADIKVRQI